MSKGGMCANPFCGRTRLDKIDLLEWQVPNQAPEKIIYAEIIKDAVNAYLHFGIGANGITADQFWESWNYLFVVRADVESTWQPSRIMRTVSEDECGKRRERVQRLDDSVLKGMCFDEHYALSGLADLMDMGRFLNRLKKLRREIVTGNWPQIYAYLEELRQREAMRNVGDGWQTLFCLADQAGLIEPDGPELASWLYYPKYMEAPHPRWVM